MFVLAIANGYFGYSLGGDLLSGAGLRIAYAIMLSIPFFGKWVPYIVLGGNVPSDKMVPHMYAMHIFVIPTLIGLLIAAHLTIIWRQMHTNLPGPRRSDVTIVGSRLYPSYSAKSIGLFLCVFALIAGLGAFVQINPIWVYGPYDPMAIMPGAQPDWYLGWIEGAMRLFPGVNIHMGYFLVPELFFPAVLMPAMVFIILYAWPWIDKWMISFDNQEHNVLRRPSQQPFNTAFGCAGIMFMLLLLIAGGDDVIAVSTNNSVAIIRTILRGLVCVLPTFTFCCVYLLCRRAKRKLPAGYTELPPENIVDDQRMIQQKGLAGEVGD
jgi:ubiquinol-cytochrome c reductase cytochrome b subunit